MSAGPCVPRPACCKVDVHDCVFTFDTARLKAPPHRLAAGLRHAMTFGVPHRYEKEIIVFFNRNYKKNFQPSPHGGRSCDALCCNLDPLLLGAPS